MVHVGAVKKRCLFVVDERIEADGAVSIGPLHGLLLNTFPKVAQFLCHASLFVHCKRFLFLLVESALYIGEEGLEQLLRVLDVLVDGFVQDACCLALFLHQVVLLTVNQSKFEPDETLAHIFAIRSII